MEEEGPLGLKRINKPLKRSKNQSQRAPKIGLSSWRSNPYNTSIQVMKLLKQENITVSISTIQTIQEKAQDERWESSNPNQWVSMCETVERYEY